jgi:hypothetical protein
MDAIAIPPKARPKVYVINVPKHNDPETGQWREAVNVQPAAEFGDLVFLTESGKLPVDPEPTLQQLRHKLRNITPRDYLLLVGDPRAIAWAAAIAADVTGGTLNLLRWQRMLGRYVTVCVEDVYGEKVS